MVAGTLVASGLNAFADDLEATDANPRGFFESKTINRLNEDLLAQVVPLRPPRWGRVFFRQRLYRGQLWLATPPLRPVIQMTPTVAEAIRAVLPPEPYCLKDPRFSYTLESWLPLLREPLCICVFRDPAISVASLLREVQRARYLRHTKFDAARAYRVWESCYQHILDLSSRAGSWLFVHYEQWLDPRHHPGIESAVGGPLVWGSVTSALARSRPSSIAPPSAVARYEELCDLAAYSRGDGSHATD